MVFFCGDLRREELPDLLKKAGIELTEVVVYQTLETPIKINKDYDGILFFSPSAVKSFFSINQVNSNALFFAIGNTTANAIKPFSKNSIIVSEFPAKDQLLDKAIKYFSNRE